MSNTYNILADNSSDRAYKDADPSRTKWEFSLLCFFLLSQSYTIPILPISSLWSIWPTLTDLCFLLATFLVIFRKREADSNSRRISKLLLITIFLNFLSFFTVVYASSDLRTYSFAIYQILKWIEIGIIFSAFSKILLNKQRLKMLLLIVKISLVINSLLIGATYLSLISPKNLGPQLPDDLQISGPWWFYIHFEGVGVGALGYNHGYVALQLLLSFGIYLYLSNSIAKNASSLFTTMVLGGIFLSESRAGLIGILLLIAFYSIQRKKYAIRMSAIILTATTLALLQGSWLDQYNDTLSRELSIVSPTDPQNLSGRTDIWSNYLNLMDQRPISWLVGNGVGSTSTVGVNAHMQLLQVFFEGGILALLIYLFFVYRILLLTYNKNNLALFFTTIALLITSFTQETFYPVPAFQNFLPFFAVALAIYLSTENSMMIRGSQ